MADRSRNNDDPRRTTAELGRAYWTFYDRAKRALAPSFLPWVVTAILEGIEDRAVEEPAGRVADIHRDLMRRLADAPLATDEAERTAFRTLYEEAKRLVFPATVAYLQHQQALLEFAHNHSLSAVDLDELRAIDLLSHKDSTFHRFVADMSAKLGSGVAAPDVEAYSQFFEIYGEAVVLRFLRARPGLRVARVAETDNPTPDFSCELDGVGEFYIEVKTLDVADGAFRQDEMMRESIDAVDNLQKQRAAGRRVAVSESEIAPYRKLNDSDYDPCSLRRVIETLQDKCRRAFKPQQFGLGPTFALAVTDRLGIPGGRNALAPYCYEPFHSGACVSGVLWHMAYGTAGSPIFRLADFEGAPTLDGRLVADGLYADPSRPFPGEGLIVLATEEGARRAWGLRAPHDRAGGLDGDQVEEILRAICDETNDELNSNAFRLSHRGHPNGTLPPGQTIEAD